MAKGLTLNCVKAVLIDLSGTLHIGSNALPGAIEAVAKLRKTALRIKFVTNTTKESVSTLHGRLNALGFNIERDEIFSSLTAAREHLRNIEECRPYLMLSDDAKMDFEHFESSDPNTVVIGLSPDHFQYDPLNKAFELILNGCPLIAIHKARYFKSPEGKLLLGPGAFVQGLEYATDTTATVVGKPEKSFFVAAAQSLECSAAECLMIGDDARDDVMGAVNSGMMGILVKTGKYRTGDENKLATERSLVMNSFAEAVDYILKSKHS